MPEYGKCNLPSSYYKMKFIDMQILRYLLVFSILLSVSSCTRYCNFDCPNTHLTFSYPSKNQDLVKNHIHSAKLLIYDDSHHLVLTKELLPKQMKKGVLLHLPPGDYLAVALANTGENIRLHKTEHALDARLLSSAYHLGEPIESTDPIYLGTQRLSVSMIDRYGKPARETIAYKSGHLKMDVKIYGLKDEAVQLKVNNLIPEFDFFMKSRSKPTTFTPKIEKVEEQDIYRSYFHVLRHKGVDPMTIDIFLDNEYSYTVDVRQLVAAKYPDFTIDSRSDFTIEVEVYFDGVQMHLKLPNWEEDNVTNTPIS